MVYIGIDPGASGGVAFVGELGVKARAYPWTTKAEMRDIVEDEIHQDGSRVPAFAALEEVHAFPRDARRAAFSFGKNFGNWEMLLVALRIPFIYVIPNTWQKWFRCQTHGDKKISKARAQELFPSMRVTLKIADALMLAEYARQKGQPS